MPEYFRLSKEQKRSFLYESLITSGISPKNFTIFEKMDGFLVEMIESERNAFVPHDKTTQKVRWLLEDLKSL